jgi:serine/threonine-protein kinase OSR1/STK39
MTDTVLSRVVVMDLETISTTFEDILQEVQTMRLCDHPNIIRCYVSFVDADKLWLGLQVRASSANQK